MRAPEGFSDREIARRLEVSNKTISRWRAQLALARPGCDRDGAGWLDGREVRGALAEKGISEQQFRRWRTAGLLPAPRRTWHKRSSRAFYPPAVVEQALAAREMVGCYRNLDFALLGLFGLGWPISERRLRSVHLAWITRSYEQMLAYQQVLEAPADPEWDEAIARLGRALTTARPFQAFRRAALRRPGERVVDATWDHLERITNLGLHGPLGDDVTADLLSRWGMTHDLDTKLTASRTAQKAFQLTELAETAMQADQAALRSGRDAAVNFHLLQFVFFDMGAMLVAAEDGEPPELLLSRDLDLDPATVAIEGLSFAALARQPELDEQFAAAVDGFDRDGLRELLAEAPERIPELDALFERFQPRDS